MRASKYNVGANINDRTYDGIQFDSKLEMRYYRDVVLPQVESGQISKYELQKPYELQPKFNHCGKNVRPIIYVADFYIEYADGHTEVIDTKGCPDSVAKMKQKMFWFKYPNITYRWITYCKKDGGWVNYEDVARRRFLEKRQLKAEREN